MPFQIVRNDITKMQTDAIVNTANDHPTVGSGCDHAVYEAAGFEELLAYRKEHIGFVPEGDVFLTPGFALPAAYIIHAVSPHYVDGKHGEEELLRSCYQKALALAAEKGFHSIAFPLISTGGFRYPKEEGMRIAIDEIHAFLLNSDMQIFLVVFDEKASAMGKKLYPDLEAYIDRHYVQEKELEEYPYLAEESPGDAEYPGDASFSMRRRDMLLNTASFDAAPVAGSLGRFEDEDRAIEEMERKLEERMSHITDSFSEYLLYLIKEKGMKNADVYNRAIVDKKVFSKIKNNSEYHPNKLTALCLCVGAKLSLDETKDLLARAGYALSPCDRTDIIFSYFIENGFYDMIELDIQLEEHGLPCVIS